MPDWLLVVLIAVGVWGAIIAALFIAGRRIAARELAMAIPNLVLLFKGLLGDPRVPRGSKAWVVFAIAWCLSPIDLIPEFIPIAGPLDDLIIAALVLRHVVRRTDRAVLQDHWHGDASTLEALVGTREDRVTHE